MDTVQPIWSFPDEILKPHVIPYASAIDQKFVIMGDNPTAQRARIISQYLHDQGVERMEWQTGSSYMDTKEHACNTVFPHTNVNQK